MHHARIAAAALVLLLATTSARAGEVRVDVANFSFTPSSITVNQGDHVVFVWQNGFHSVTGGTAGVPDNTFDSGELAAGTAPNNTAFSWQANTAGAQPFFCSVHFASGMTGTITVNAGTAVSVATFRITEVMYRPAAGEGLIEIENMGKVAGDLGRFRVAVPGGSTSIPLASLPVAKDGIVVLHVGVAGANSATDVYLPDLPTLPDSAGSVALYAPNTAPGFTSLDDATQIVDYVEYGGGGEDHEATATTAGLWGAGTFVPRVGSAGRSIEFCGTKLQYGAAQWAEVSVPNFGSDANCVTPTRQETWGRVKAHYR